LLFVTHFFVDKVDSVDYTVVAVSRAMPSGRKRYKSDNARASWCVLWVRAI